MTRLLPIDCCQVCLNRITLIDEVFGGNFCRLTKRHRRIKNIKTIPSWCKLERGKNVKP